MKSSSFGEALDEIIHQDGRYTAEAYHFVREGLDFTIKLMAKPLEGPARHVSGPELLDGIRKFALQEYGPLTKTVLNKWGIQECADVGEMVFSMVDKGILGKTEDDEISDFTGGFDFDDAFRKPFLPAEEDHDDESGTEAQDDASADSDEDSPSNLSDPSSPSTQA
ncbi:MAG: putative repeat protein (TIGR04138 family) [Kiritimatiellia bacterium]|jgi:uncharacterized repeat protein (TIGR04138 family)